MPPKAGNSTANAKPQKANSKSKSVREPSLRDLRRRLVGFRYDLLRKLMVTVFVIVSAELLAPHLSYRRLAEEYPAALANSRVAMNALGANAKSAIEHAYNRAGAMLPAADKVRQRVAAIIPVRKQAPAVTLASAAVAHSARETAHRRVYHRPEMAPVRERKALLHARALHAAARATATINAADVSVEDGDAANWLMNRFPVELGDELSKAYYKLLNFAYYAITLEWAPGLRDSLSISMQSATDRFTSEDGFTMSDLSSLLKSIATSNGLIACGTGLLLFMMLAGFSAWLRRAAES